MRPANFLPIRDVGDVHPRADYVVEGGAGFLESGGNVLQSLYRLRVGVADSHDLSIRASCRSPGDVYLRADPHSARISNHWLPRSATRNFHAFHSISFSLRFFRRQNTFPICAFVSHPP